LQNTFLFCVKLRDYHTRMKRCILVICHYQFRCHKSVPVFRARYNRHKNRRQNLSSNLWRQFLAPASGVCVPGFMGRMREMSLGKFKVRPMIECVVYIWWASAAWPSEGLVKKTAAFIKAFRNTCLAA